MKFLDYTVLSRFGPSKDKNFSKLYKYLVSYGLFFYEMYSHTVNVRGGVNKISRQKTGFCCCRQSSKNRLGLQESIRI